MANLRDIRNRITSVNNTKQITKAMKMVAAAKLRKAQTRMVETRPYASKLKEVVGRLVENSTVENDLLRIPEDEKRILIIVVGSDRGLCGGFNNNLFRVIEGRIQNEFIEFQNSENLDLACIGRKSIPFFRKRNYNIVEEYPGFFENLNYSDAMKIMQKAMHDFTDGKYDRVYIGYNEFKSVITQTRIVKKVLPIDPVTLAPGSSEKDSKAFVDYIYEPNVTGILEKLLPLHLHIQLWSALLESNAAEQGARMAAMDNATENAKELEDELRLKYNQARQSAITTEISEIVSGAQAMKDS